MTSWIWSFPLADGDRHRQPAVGEVGVVVLPDGVPDDPAGAHVEHRVEVKPAYTDTLGDEVLGSLGAILAGLLVARIACRSA